MLTKITTRSSHLPVQQGFQGFLSAWPIIIFPLVALVLMWLVVYANTVTRT